ncbi:MGDG synthase family glycosyltransferase [Ralstonia flaminis]|jgi:processive 1,2-diacylglycerol beta-glucosyltransferase|uniref:Processive diacylglycerol beta-glucosyltransferase n=1 Tax=Ralstonia flaminis TaxID=3058597 RepID=A0ABM9K686_9RALS|nr:glycosyltransferase [Ralstonia sp. LMG 18101]CAJ0815018.1 Processive diacylglycerol beta-glucosyltransferase [Ralstonia sp. LMG 18101]
MKKILLLSVSAGAGHMRAAEAIRAFADAHPAGIEATHLDVMDFVSAGFRKLYTDFYIKLVSNQPALWGYLYQKTDETAPSAFSQKIRRAVERLNSRPLLAEIKRQRPDAIICTHFLPAELLSRELRKERLDVPVWVQVTDFDLHSMWIVPNMRGYFAANEEIAWRMRERGLAADAVHVSGIPVMPAFGKPLDRSACAAEFGIDPKRKTFLMMSGGAGLGGLDALAERLLAMEGDFQLIALAGKNQTMLEALQRVAQRHPGRLFPQGFTHQVERLMACADLVITKPGGLTTSECLAMQLPMIVNSPIPGQEERNADFLLEQGVALKAIDDAALEFRIQALLKEPDRLTAMRHKIAPLGRPNAGQFVLDRVLDLTAQARAA